jgi:hypothetical protein
MNRLIPSLISIMAILPSVSQASYTAVETEKLAGLSPKQWVDLANSTQLSLDVIYGLALRESGRYNKETNVYSPSPTAIGIGPDPKVGQEKHESYLDLSPEQSEDRLRNLVDEGHTNLGLGMFQISYRYNKWRVEDPQMLFEPAVNAKAAAGVLNDCKKRFNDVRGMLSCYRSGKINDRGTTYAEDVLALADKYGKTFTAIVTSHMKNAPPAMLVTRNTHTTKRNAQLDLLNRYYTVSRNSVQKPSYQITILE